jgi:hypothetical protein
MAKIDKILAKIGEQHGFSLDAMQALGAELLRGGLKRARFNHPELGGIGMWSHGEVVIGDMSDEETRVRIWQVVDALMPALKQVEVSEDVRRATQDQTLVMPWWGDIKLGSPAVQGVMESLTYGYFLESHRVIVRKDDKITHYDASGLAVMDIGIVYGERAMPQVALQLVDGTVPVSDLPIIT